MRKSFIILLLSIILFPLRGQTTPETLQQWKGDKYSMFIHWGIYSELGGVWKGKQISYGLSEQIQAHAGIYSDVYAQVAKRFNPVLWNPDSVVLLAKQAGMRSIVITSKHHDGFCMFHSAHTDYNVVDATPYKHDVVGELSAACARHGLKFGLYFSLIDWHYPQASPISSHNSDIITPEHFEFNKKQIRELLTNYGPISELWFDMGSHSFEQSLEMRHLVHSLQPDCMIGSRLG
ncbi:MAG: alpha-L-fucosidase, partial [Bacteroidales bacterium]|nr:alpha-L-fucosidase [Bacteroidales bacterium]